MSMVKQFYQTVLPYEVDRRIELFYKLVIDYLDILNSCSPSRSTMKEIYRRLDQVHRSLWIHGVRYRIDPTIDNQMCAINSIIREPARFIYDV